MDFLMMSVDLWMLGLGRPSVLAKGPYFEQNGVKFVGMSAVSALMLDEHWWSVWRRHEHKHCGEPFKANVEDWRFK
jgi:hypothetical protein